MKAFLNNWVLGLFIVVAYVGCTQTQQIPGIQAPTTPAHPLTSPTPSVTLILPSPPHECSSPIVQFPVPTVHPHQGQAWFRKQKDAVALDGGNSFSLAERGINLFGLFDRQSGLPLDSYHDFQLSLVPQPIEALTGLGNIAGLPLVGKYDSEGYNLMQRLAVIQMDAALLENILPASLREKLPAQLAPGTTKENLFDHLNGTDTRFYFVALGQPRDLNHSLLNHWFNIAFHPWNALWHPDADPNKRPLDFNEATPMGLFQEGGLFNIPDFSVKEAASFIPFDEFAEQGVNYHHPYFSPSNGQFGVIPACGFSAFWAAAVSPNKQHVNISYFLLANNSGTEAALADIIHGSNTLEEIKNRVEAATIAPYMYADAHLENEASRRSLVTWTKALTHALGL